MRGFGRSRADRRGPHLDPATWVVPWGWGRPDVARTRIGTVDSRHRVTVDPRGLVSVPAGGSTVPTLSLDWWVGADDRWHLPSVSAAVRQALIDDAPVVETRVRIPGGDAVHRAYVVRAPGFAGEGAGDEYVVVEVENQTPVPFALALVLRPFGAQGAPLGAGRIELVGGAPGATIVIDGAPALVLSRPPARAAGATGWTDVAERVTSGAAPAELADQACGRAGAGPTAAFVLPVPHTATVRVALPLGASPGADVADPASLPPAASVANGWAIQARRGSRTDVPDTGLVAGVEGARRALLLVGPGELELAGVAALVSALDREGFHDDAAAALATLADRLAATRPDRATAGSVLAAAVDHWRCTGDERLASALLPELAALARRAGRGGAVDPDTFAGLAHLLASLGQPGASAELGARAAAAPTAARPGPDRRWTAVRDAVAGASPTWAWPEGGVGPSGFLHAVRALLVDERPDGLDLLPGGMRAWWGQGIELHDAPTRFGVLSFAVRWHGDRPALLWDVGPPATAVGGDLPVVALTARAIDVSWSSTDRQGECLLAPVPRPDDAAAPVPARTAAEVGRAEAVAPRSVLPLGRSARSPGNDGAGAARGDDHGGSFR